MNDLLRRGLCWLCGGVLLAAAAPSLPLLAQEAPRTARAKPARSAAHKRTREQKREARRERAARRAARSTTRPSTKATPTREAAVHAPAAPSASAREAAAAAQAGAVDATIVKEGGTSVKVMTFEGLDIEGRLRSPQLVYFTQRVRAEFERPTLPHRSFLPELESTTQREPVR